MAHLSRLTTNFKPADRRCGFEFFSGTLHLGLEVKNILACRNSGIALVMIEVPATNILMSCTTGNVLKQAPKQCVYSQQWTWRFPYWSRPLFCVGTGEFLQKGCLRAAAADAIGMTPLGAVLTGAGNTTNPAKKNDMQPCTGLLLRDLT